MTISSLEAGRLLRRAGFSVHHQTSTHIYYDRGGERIMIAATRQDIPKPVEHRVLLATQGKKDSRTLGREAERNKIMLPTGAQAPEPSTIKKAWNWPLIDWSQEPQREQEEEVQDKNLEPTEPRKGLLGILEEFTLAAEIEHEELSKIVADVRERVDAYRKVQGVCNEFGIELPELPDIFTNGVAEVDDVRVDDPPPHLQVLPDGTYRTVSPKRKHEREPMSIEDRLDRMFTMNGNTLTRTQVGQNFGGKGCKDAYAALDRMPNVTKRLELGERGHRTQVYTRYA